MSNPCIVGSSFSSGTAGATTLANSVGIIGSATDGFKVSGAKIFNFHSGMTVIQSNPISFGCTETRFEGISYFGVDPDATKVNW